MRILIAAIGRKRGGPEAVMTQDYIGRAQALGKRLGFADVSLVQAEAPKGLSGAGLKKREGELLLNAAPDGGAIILLDEKGDNIASADLAQMLGKLRDDGAAHASFLIGGADGHGEMVRARATRSIAFGAATWPHMLVRAMLTEQLYRAMTILSGHPYHRV